jgi:hypothetical protein
MCWSAKVSLNTFMFSLFGTLFALSNGVITLQSSLFVLSFISMQLLEYFAWKNLDNKRMIRFLSQVGTFIIISQVVFAINSNKSPWPWYLAFACITLLMFATTKIDYSMHKAPNGHLAWNWLSSWPKWYVMFWVLFTLLHMKNYYTFAFSVVTLLVTFYTYYSSETWGSMWCWFANFFAFYLIAKVFYKDLCY